MVGARAYDLLYRFWAPWDSDEPRPDLLHLLDRGMVDAERYPRSIDLGCGTGANVVHLAEHGFESYGVDLSKVAIDKAKARATEAGVPATFVLGDLTAETIPGIDGSFDLIIDFGTLDDLRGEPRRAMARTITRLARPGAKFLEYCFYGATEDLPRISFNGASRMSHIAPGEMERHFGNDWDIEVFSDYPDWGTRCFLSTRR